MDRVKRVLNWTLVKLLLEGLIFFVLMDLFQRIYQSVLNGHTGDVDFGGTFAPIDRALWGIAAMFISYCAAVLIVERRPIGELSLAKLAQDGFVGSGYAFLALSSMIGIMAILGGYSIIEVNPDFRFLFVFAWVFLFALGEEIMFRGFLYRTFEGRFGTVFAMLISSLPFGIAHIGNDYATLVSTGAIIFAGFWLGILYTWSNFRLWVPIFAHTVWNFGQIVYGVPVSGFQVNGFIDSNVSGPEWITGGHFGPEASYLTFGLLVVMSIGFYLHTQKKGLIVPFKLKGDPWVAAQDEDAVETA
jgi:membrane protease YdiL (CAAX protease family)